MAIPFLSPTVQQVAAVPFVVTATSIDLLLITSRRQRRWIVPKGWPQKRRTLAETAATEAFEEAGVTGRLIERPIGSYRSAKNMAAGYDVPASVLAFPLLVEEEALDWPEQAERERCWRPFHEALTLLSEPHLVHLLRKTLRPNGDELRSMIQMAA